MPEMDGLTATRLIREAEAAAGAPRVPIIAVTADAMLENRELCLEAGMDECLVKPLDPTLFRETLRRLAPV
jgi:CheY-like chemotaxis protein